MSAWLGMACWLVLVAGGPGAPEALAAEGTTPRGGGRSALALQLDDVAVRLAGPDREEVEGALVDLDAMLQISDWRRAEVQEGLETGDVLAAMWRLNEAARGRRWKETVAAALEQVEARLDVLRARQGPTAEVATGMAMVQKDALRWYPASSGRLWLGLPLAADSDQEVWLRGCDAVELRLFGPSMRREGPPVWVDDFSPARLPSPGFTGAGFIRVDPGPACSEGYSVAVVRRPAPPGIPAGTSLQAPVVLAQEGAWRVLPRDGASVWARLTLAPGTLYEVATSDLRGPTDTRLSLTLPSGAELVDDDSGGGFSSSLRFDTLTGGTALIRVDLLRSGPDSSFDLSVTPVFKYQVTQPVNLGSEVADLPGAAWSGHVVPVEIRGERGRFLLQAVRGNVYHIQTGLDVEIIGPKGERALRLLREEAPAPWAVRPVKAFLALESGPSELVLRPPAEGAEGVHELPWFVQVVDLPAQPEPRQTELGDQPFQAYPMISRPEGDSDGGVLALLGPGATGWLSFDVVPGTGYTVFVDGSVAEGQVGASLWYGKVVGKPLEEDQRHQPVALVHYASELPGRVYVAVKNLGDSENRVRVAVSANVPYDGLRVGDEIRIGRHRPIAGVENWTVAMDVMVGRNAIITERAGEDASGAWVVRLDVDDGQHVWRTRDMTLTRRRSGR